MEFFIILNYLNLVAETEIVAPAPTNAQGVLGGVQECPGGPLGGPEIVELPMQ